MVRLYLYIKNGVTEVTPFLRYLTFDGQCLIIKLEIKGCSQCPMVTPGTKLKIQLQTKAITYSQ